VEPDSGITSYLHIPATALGWEPQRSLVLALFLQSVDWRAAGPYQPTGGAASKAAPGQPAEMCPVHFTAMLRGHCDLCD
jgi:hypothetical protein